MKHWQVTYYDLDDNIKTHAFNSSTLEHAIAFAERFCERFGFSFSTLVEVGL